jgi:2-iminobutanoate/2-iminopropanoate deaminase
MSANDRRLPVLQAEGAPRPSGAYSPGIRVNGLLFLSGQLPIDDTGNLRRGTVGEQVALALDNLDRVARAAGGRIEHAVRVGVYLRDLADFDEMDAAYRARFGEVFPARTTIQTDFHETDVEIDAVVALPSD